MTSISVGPVSAEAGRPGCPAVSLQALTEGDAATVESGGAGV